jgi:hypothetical protein
VHPNDLLATVDYSLGIDPDMTVLNHLNQRRELVKASLSWTCGSAGEPVKSVRNAWRKLAGVGLGRQPWPDRTPDPRSNAPETLRQLLLNI